MVNVFSRFRDWVRGLSFARKIIAVIMGVSGTALLLACLAVIRYDTTTARTTLTRDIAMLADVVGATSTATVAFSDAKNATDTLKAVAVNKNVRTAAILQNGTVFARFSRLPETEQTPIPAGAFTPAGQVDATFERDGLWLVRPLMLDGELIGSVFIESGLEELWQRRRHLV